jgi:asparagine synthase (glutamine-hydrolysing)
MIAAVLGGSDEAALRLVELFGSVVPQARALVSARDGVTIAAWSGPGAIPSTFEGDQAYVGQLYGGMPRPGRDLRGDFALVARVDGGMRLSRARFGGRPLHWMRLGDRVVACDRLLPLALAVGRDAHLNVEHLLAIFDGRFPQEEDPLAFLGARRVRSNTIVDFDASGRATTQWGPVVIAEPLRLTPAEIASAMRHEFSAAVDRTCAGARRVAVFGGGGVDSSNLLATAVGNSRRGGAEVLSVAVDYPGPGNDTPHLLAVGRHVGVESKVVQAAEGAPDWGRDRVVDASAHATVPLSMAIAAFRRAKMDGAERALFGECSEALLDDHQAVFGAFMLAAPFRALARAPRRQVIDEGRARSFVRFAVGPLGRRFFPAAFDARDRLLQLRATARRRRQYPWAGPRLRNFLSEHRAHPDAPAIFSQRERVTRLASSALLMRSREHMSRWEIAGGLPIALPYLDDDFVRFVGRIPDDALFATGRERGMLRESMRGLVPESVRNRMDKATPYRALQDLFTASGGARSVDELLPMRGLSALGIVDARRFREAFDKFAADPHDVDADWHGVWGAITAEAYVQWFHRLVAGGKAAVAEDPIVRQHARAS